MAAVGFVQLILERTLMSSDSYTDTSTSSDGPSVYELLSASERIGSVSFDWRQIPVDLIQDLPESDRPPKGSSARNLAKRASQGLGGKRKGREQKAPSTPPQKSNQQGMRDEIHQLPLTFNNCHFHLEGDGEAAATGTGERGRPHLPSLANLISERISKQQDHWQDKPRPASQSSSFAVPSHSRESPRTSPSRMSMSELGRARKNLPQIPGAPYSVSSPLEKIRGSAPKHQTHHLVDDLSLTEPSNYILEGIEREKQVLATVHQELSDLSKDLKERSSKIQLESQRLDLLKKSLEEGQRALDNREKSIKKEAQQLVALKMKKKEQDMKEATKGVVVKYEEALEHLGRENKRLQSSLKDMVSTNRLLRDQNKILQTESDEKDQKIEDLSLQIKQGKDRNERLKAMIASSPKNSPQPATQPLPVSKDAEDMFNQMKKILALHSVDKRPSTTDTAAQHEGILSKDTVTADKGAKTKNEGVSLTSADYRPFIRLLYFLLNKGSLVPFFDAINGTYPYLESQAQSRMDDAATTEIGHAVFESYLELIFHGSKHLNPLQKHKIGELVYGSLSLHRSSNSMSLTSFKTSLLLHLIPLVTIDGQPEVTNALLEGILIQSNQSIPTRKFLIDVGLSSLFGFLKGKKSDGAESTLDLVSTILLTLLTEDEFYSKVSLYMDEVFLILSGPLPLKTTEALVVVLQKITSRGRALPENVLDLISKQLHDRSDFCSINVKSILLMHHKTE